MTSQFQKGIELFNQEQFFEAHEVWEKIWLRAKQNKNPNENFLKGLIQAAAAFHHLKNKNTTGALSLFKASISHLKAYEQKDCEIELGNLLRSLEKTSSDLRSNSDALSQKFPRIKLKN